MTVVTGERVGEELAGGDSISSVSKALALLEVMAMSDGRAMGVSDLALVTDMPKSTAHRLLKAMEQRGFIGRTGSKYRVGSRCLQLSSVARTSEYGVLLEHAAPALEWLFERTGQTVHLAVLDGDDALYLEKINGRGGCQMRTRPGVRLRANTTAVGQALIAVSDGRPGTTPPEPSVALERIRRSGVVVSRDAGRPGFVGVAAPVLVSGRAPAPAAISVDGPVGLMQPEAFVQVVREGATRMARQLSLHLDETA